jgi:Na+/proline symporter
MGALWPISLIPRWLLTMGIATLAIVGFTEVADPEKILPMVLEQYLPVGVMGLALAGLIAASMSTLDSTINAGASYAVRDIYQKFINPKATQRNLVIAGYLSSIFIVGTGLLIGLKITSIAQIWNWFILGWGAGIMVPSILGWYWWRFNAKGYIFGTLAGVLAAMLQGLIFPSAPLYLTFPIITLISLSSSILVSKLTSPSAQRVLTRFYKDIQPGGFWRPIKELVKGEKPSFKRESSFKSELGNAFLATGWITCLYSIPVYLMIHKLKPMCFCLGLTILLMIILYFTWYRRLKKSTKTDIKS